MNHLTYMHGALTTLCVIAALFFVRLWRRARERFYLFFAIAFGLMAALWVVSASGQVGEHALWPYATRLVAFLVIIVAIVDKNRRAAGS
jgi:peptidoglycan/LPS O-acetylase OafA/YrhL